MDVRTATQEDVVDISNVLDGALLDVEMTTLRSAIDDRSVLLAVTSEEDTDERVVGVVVLVENEIVALAVRRRRRGQGIGTTLVQESAKSRDVLTAEFDERVRPFWGSLGFTITPIEDTDRFEAHRRFDR